MLATWAHARPRSRPWLNFAVTGALVLALCLLAWARPAAYNWDMLAYTAIALDEGDAAARHALLWEYIDRDVPAPKRAVLRGEQLSADQHQHQKQNPVDELEFRAADTKNYRRITASNPVAFAEQLPFYSVKPLYPALIRLYMAASSWLPGVTTELGPVHASVIVAKLSWVAFGVSLFLLLRLRLTNGPATLCTVLGMSLPTVHTLSGYSSPDALSAMFILLGFVFALRDPSRTWTLAAAGVALLGVTARPDNLVLLAMLLCWFVWSRRIRLRSAIVVGGLGVGWYLLFSRLSNNYGWAVLMHHSFFDYAEFPSQLRPQLSVGLLLQLYLSKLGASLTFFQFTGFGVLVGLARWQRRGRHDQLLQALLLMLGFMLVHWIIFPDEKDRLMVAPYLFILASAVFVLADHCAKISQQSLGGYVD